MLYVLLLIGGLSSFLIFHTYYVMINKTEIKAQISGRFSFVHITDIHGTINFLNGKLSSIINNLNPDFVVVTGDLSNNLKELPKVLKELEKIKAKEGIFVVPGNYENEELVGFRKRSINTELLEQLFSNTSNIRYLKNQYFILNTLNSKILIYGFDNGTYGNENYNFDTENIRHDYKIILAHSPKIIDYIDKNNISFNQLLAGHTHGGQIRVFNNLHLKDYKDFHIGIKKHRTGLFSISRGLGTVKIPFRFNCFPEISYYSVIPNK